MELYEQLEGSAAMVLIRKIMTRVFQRAFAVMDLYEGID